MGPESAGASRGRRLPGVRPLLRPVALAAAAAVELAAGLSLAQRGAQAAITALVLVVLVTAAAPFPGRAVRAVVAAAWLSWLVGAAAGSSLRALDAALLLAASLLATHLRRELGRLRAELGTEAAAASAAAVRDPLTGLANQRGLAMVAVPMLEAARRQGNALHCLVVDVDALPHVNERLGPEGGDRVLVGVGQALAGCVRGTDAVARWSGAAFCVVGPGAGMAPLELEQRVRDRLLAAPPVERSAWEPHVSAGSAVLPPWDNGSLASLVEHADRQMRRRRELRRVRPAKDALPPRVAD